MTRRRLAPVLALLAFAAAAPAQLTEPQAIAQAKSGAKAALPALKADIKAALQELDADLDAFEATLDGGNAPGDAAAALGAAINALQTALGAAVNDAIAAADEAAAAALEALAGSGGDLAGVFPEPLYYGTRGVLDAHLEKVLKLADGTLKAARKRLAQTEAKAEATGLLLAFVLDRPGRQEVSAVGQGLVTAVGGGAGGARTCRLDGAVSASRAEALEDGVLFATGAGEDGTNLDVQALVLQAFVDSVPATFDGGSQRFTAVLDNSGAGHAEGGYVLLLDQGASSFTHAAAIGLR
jgi:hypothetical protein